MIKKFVLISVIIISLVSCSDKNYTTGQVGPSRGIIFNVNGNDIEARIYTLKDSLNYEDAIEISSNYEVINSWNKVFSGYRLPTEEELKVITQNKYFAALETPPTDLLWSIGSSTQYNYKINKSVDNYDIASLMLVRDVN